MLPTMISSNKASEDNNSFLSNYKLGKQTGSCGVGQVWKVYEASRITDGKDCSVFLFEKKTVDKLHKPKRKEIVASILKRDVITMSRIKYPKILKTLDFLQENNNSLAFATEPVIGSLANLLTLPQQSQKEAQQKQPSDDKSNRLPFSNSVSFDNEPLLEVEIVSGVQQVCKALNHLHNVERIVHLNVCPDNILVTRKRLWKLSGFGYVQSFEAGPEESGVRPWQSKQSKMAQPDMDFMAPEVQLMTSKLVAPSCDVFSVAMLIGAIYNGGMSLLQTNHNPANYSRQLDQIQDNIESISAKLPEGWIEMISKIVNRDTRCRPNLQSLLAMKCFSTPIVSTLDSLESEHPARRIESINSLHQILPLFPTKLLYTTVLYTAKELLAADESTHLGMPILVAIISNSTDEEYASFVAAELRGILERPKNNQTTLCLLENMEVLMSKASDEEIKSDIIPLVFNTLDSNNLPGQEAALKIVNSLKESFDEETIINLVLPKAKTIFHRTTSVKTKVACLECMVDVLDNIEKMELLENVLPFLLGIQSTDADVIMAMIDIFEAVLNDKRLSLSHNILASKIMPFIVPFSALPGLSIEQFTKLMETMKDMLDEIERQRLSKMADEMPDDEDLERLIECQSKLELQPRRSSLDNRQIEASSHMPVIFSIPVESPPFVQPSSVPVRSKLSVTENREPLDILNPPLSSNRRHSSYQGLEQKEQTALEILYNRQIAKKNSPATKISNFLSPLTSGKPKRSKRLTAPTTRQRRSSKYLPQPSIMVSEPSVNDFTSLKNQLLTSAGLGAGSRRPSATSMTSVNATQENKTLGVADDSGRRSSFQGICDQAMQLFK